MSVHAKSVGRVTNLLLLSSLLSAPWKRTPVVAWGLLGFAGLVYCAIVVWRVRRQTDYKPLVEDWMYYVLLPLVAYVVLAASAFVADSHEHGALFGVATSALLLLFDGIHNAWDSVTYHVISKRAGRAERT